MSERFNPLGGQESKDVKFMTKIISQICNYAVENQLNPTDTVSIIGNNLVLLAEISDFDNWKHED